MGTGGTPEAQAVPSETHVCIPGPSAVRAPEPTLRIGQRVLPGADNGLRDGQDCTSFWDQRAGFRTFLWPVCSTGQVIQPPQASLPSTRRQLVLQRVEVMLSDRMNVKGSSHDLAHSQGQYVLSLCLVGSGAHFPTVRL